MKLNNETRNLRTRGAARTIHFRARVKKEGKS